MSHVSAEMQAYYAARAPYYDAVYLKPERAQDIAFLSNHLGSRLAGRSVLEIACGTGYWTQYIAPHVQNMVVTDGTAEPLEFARQRPGTANATFSKCDAYDLPVSLGQFSGAYAGLWFSHVPIEARAHFLRSLHARLEPGARVLFLDNSVVQCREHPIAETDILGNTFQHRQLRDGNMHRVLKNFPLEAELRALVASHATTVKYTELQNFWLLEYELKFGAIEEPPRN
jgi:ubiquinone/menaquinone biosynthesis C-methylase UbiE